jgi:glutamate/tyrosine decarboxylase-like PLP-dependent enzyme
MEMGPKMRDKALPEDEVMRILEETRAHDYNYDRFLSTMCTLPHPIAVRAHNMFIETNLGDPGLFPGVAELEENVVHMLGEMPGMKPAERTAISSFPPQPTFPSTRSETFSVWRFERPS